MPRRPALIAAAALAAAGLALALVLVREHANAFAGGTSFCAINEYVNCDRVATSRYSVVLGLPVAVWGAFGYGLALLLALAGLSPRRRRAGWPAGLLLLVASICAAAGVVLAGISHLAIGALCLLCSASWLVSFGLLVAAWRACRPAGAAAALRDDLGLLRERPAQAVGVAVAGLALVAVVAAALPRWWEAPPRAAVPPGGAGVAAPPGTGSQGPTVVVVFSDYLCPACARAHEETRALLAGRTDVQVARRQFPLDSDCNPALSRRMHPGACDLARIGICAEAQGKLQAAEDLLFANQAAHRPIPEVVRAIGLDQKKLEACLASPETEARLRADIEAAVRIGLRATPTFVVRGTQYQGRLPPEALPPAPAAPPAQGASATQK
jgi:protein-disulfide isomerase